MRSPQFISGNIATHNEKQSPLYMLRKVNARSIASLYFSQMLLTLGFILVVLNNLNIIAPGSYFGVYNWVTTTVFSIGLIINFFSIPYLYFSSFINFSKDNDFWDRETFWILPLFFFGTFFLYGSNISAAIILLIISIVVIMTIHLRFIWVSWKFMKKESCVSIVPKHQYFMTLKYLTIYYVILLVIMIVVNPLQSIFTWIRMNF